RAYQQQKLAQIKAAENINDDLKSAAVECVLNKSCLCHDLGGAFTVKHNIDPAAHTAVCPGPNIVYFSKLTNLQEMADHIYGRLSLITKSDKPHMFVQELKIYIEHLKHEIEKSSCGLINLTPKYFAEFKQNLVDGIKHYKEMAKHLKEQKDRFLADLEILSAQLEMITQDLIQEPEKALV
ncbi:MAG: hypothetical protein JXN60_08230, partial [Lentisphaerae bacterium]|nr:hypothetical protein [Lentisphaerota bacterium]